MKIVFLVYAKPETGLGHWYRTIELAKRAEERGHYVTIVGNRMARPFTFFQVRENEEYDLYHVLHQIDPDWLVVDLQDSVPDYIYNITKTRLAVLNGVGYDKEDEADLTIIQGFSDKNRENILSGEKYVVLRKELFEAKQHIDKKAKDWFVWGGTKDKMGILTAFPLIMPESKASLVISKMFPIELKTISNPAIHTPVFVDDSSIIPLMTISNRACVAMGMIAWELAALEIPAYVFSVSNGHLGFANKMQENGLLLAYPEIGLPEENKVVEFLSTPFEITGNPPDEKGADRILAAMENF